MRSMTRKIRRLTSKILELPQDVILDLPRITMIGNLQLYIENHRGVMGFTSKQLLLRLSVGTLDIRGEQLVIRTILSEEVFIEGIIQDVHYIPTKQGK